MNVKAIKSALMKIFKKTMNYSGIDNFLKILQIIYMFFLVEFLFLKQTPRLTKQPKRYLLGCFNTCTCSFIFKFITEKVNSGRIVIDYLTLFINSCISSTVVAEVTSITFTNSPDS